MDTVSSPLTVACGACTGIVSQLMDTEFGQPTLNLTNTVDITHACFCLRVVCIACNILDNNIPRINFEFENCVCFR